MKIIAHRRQRLNVKLLMILVLIAFLLYLTVTWWHGRQIRTAALQLRERGESARKAGNHRVAVEELGRYVGFIPEDTDALADYTDSLSEIGSTQEVRQQVFALNEEVLRRRPNDLKIRAFQAKLALDLNRTADASSHIESIELEEPLTADLWFVRGRCYESTRLTDKAIESFQETLALEPDHIQATERLAALLGERKGDQENADKLLTDLVRRTGSVEALLLRARRYAQAGNEQAAIDDLKTAVELDPGDRVAVSAFAAAVHRYLSNSNVDLPERDGLRDQAISAIRARLQTDAENTQLRMYFVRLLWLARGDRPEAMKVLEQGYELEPNDQDVLFALVDAMISTERIDEAETKLQRFDNQLESRQRSQFLKARIKMARSEWANAQTELSELIASVPREQSILRRARMYEAACLRELNENQSAVGTYERALDETPNSKSARMGLAESYLRSDQMIAAINQYRRLKGIPRIAAFLTDLIIEYQSLQPAALRQWSEAQRLTNPATTSIADPIQRAVLTADMLFAQGETQAGWDLLVKTRNANSDDKDISTALDQATALLLDRAMATADSGKHEVSANTAIKTVVQHWSRREDAARIVEYFEQHIGQAAEQDVLIRRMTVSLFLCGQITKRLAARNSTATPRFTDYANDLSKRLTQLEPLALGQRLQWLGESGQKSVALQELESSPAQVRGFAATACLPFLYGDSGSLSRVRRALQESLSELPDDLELKNAEAACLSAMGQHDEAIKLWTQLHEDHPDARNVALNLAWLHAVYKSDFQRASAVLGTVKQQGENDTNYLATKACVEIAGDNLPLAETTLKTLLRQSVHLSHLVHLGYVQAVQGKTGEATVLLRRASSAGISSSRLHPLDKVILDQLAKTISN